MESVCNQAVDNSFYVKSIFPLESMVLSSRKMRTWATL